MTPTEREEFEAKAAAVLSDPVYDASLRREAEERERQERRARHARLRELAMVAAQALNGEHGEQHQKFAQDALTKYGDVRPDVAALARWDVEYRKAEPPLPLDRPILKRAVESSAVEHSLRAFEALRRELERKPVKKAAATK